MQRFGASQRQACRVLKLSRSVYSYQSVASDSSALGIRIREITQTRAHYGYRRVHVMLRREGWRDNHKRVYRLYREQGLSLRHKRPRRNKSARLRQPKQTVPTVNEIWSMDFVAGALFDGRRLRTLTIVDNYTRECLAINVRASLRGETVARCSLGEPVFLSPARSRSFRLAGGPVIRETAYGERRRMHRLRTGQGNASPPSPAPHVRASMSGRENRGSCEPLLS